MALMMRYRFKKKYIDASLIYILWYQFQTIWCPQDILANFLSQQNLIPCKIIIFKSMLKYFYLVREAPNFPYDSVYDLTSLVKFRFVKKFEKAFSPFSSDHPIL